MIEREFLRHFEIRSLPYTHRHSTSDKQAIDSIHLDGGDEEEVCFGLPDSLTSVSEGPWHQYNLSRTSTDAPVFDVSAFAHPTF
jgi:hypothetical protein